MRSAGRPGRAARARSAPGESTRSRLCASAGGCAHALLAAVDAKPRPPAAADAEGLVSIALASESRRLAPQRSQRTESSARSPPVPRSSSQSWPGQLCSESWTKRRQSRSSTGPCRRRARSEWRPPPAGRTGRAHRGLRRWTSRRERTRRCLSLSGLPVLQTTRESARRARRDPLAGRVGRGRGRVQARCRDTRERRKLAGQSRFDDLLDRLRSARSRGRRRSPSMR